MDTIDPLLGLLKKSDVKRITFRYKGSEGRGLVFQANFVHRDGHFLTYEEITQSRIPENRLFEIAEEALSSKIPTWADDWGSNGEIVWNLGSYADIRHCDRQIEEAERSISISARDLNSLLGPVEPPVTEIARVTAIRAEFWKIEDTESWIFDQHTCEHPAGDFIPSKSLKQATSDIFQIALQRAKSKSPKHQQHNIIRGNGVWVPGERVLLDYTVQMERLRPKTYQVNIAI